MHLNSERQRKMGRQKDWSPLKDWEEVSSVCQLCLIFATPWTAAHQASISITNSRSPSNPCPLSWWCNLTIFSSVVPFSSCPKYFPASGSLPMSQLFASDGQNIGVSVSTSVFPVNTQDWYPLGWTGWISLQSKGLSRVFSSTTVQKHQFFGTQLFYSPTFNPYLTTEKL